MKQKSDNTQDGGSGLEKLTRLLAGKLSRRTFGKQVIVTGAAVIGLKLFQPIPAHAVTCNYGEGDCDCHSSVVVCTPGGGACWSYECWTPNQDPCIPWAIKTKARLQVCDDGTKSYSCSACCC